MRGFLSLNLLPDVSFILLKGDCEKKGVSVKEREREKEKRKKTDFKHVSGGKVWPFTGVTHNMKFSRTDRISLRQLTVLCRN